jgi:formylglycine-generating enzyme required for sulfatase activity
VKSDAADVSGYLTNWQGDMEPGAAQQLDEPVTAVSWYAATAFCSARGSRLPTLAEWEYVAAADGKRRDASRDPSHTQHIINLYTTRAALPRTLSGAEVNAYGVRALHDRVWEWVADPNERIAALHHSGHHHGSDSGVHDLSCAGASLGAADPRNYPAFLRQSLRSALAPTSASTSLGFRCAA